MRDKTQILLEQAYQKVLQRSLVKEFYNGDDPWEGYSDDVKDYLVRNQDPNGLQFAEVDENGQDASSGSGFVLVVNPGRDGKFTFGPKTVMVKQGDVYKVQGGGFEFVKNINGTSSSQPSSAPKPTF